MKANRKRKPFGERLIASMQEGLDAIKADKPLPQTFVAIPPDPPKFERSRLLALRERFGMSQAAFAQLLNVSDKAVESWEQGVRKPNGAVLRLLQVIEEPGIMSVKHQGSRLAKPGRRATRTKKPQARNA